MPDFDVNLNYSYAPITQQPIADLTETKTAPAAKARAPPSDVQETPISPPNQEVAAILLASKKSSNVDHKQAGVIQEDGKLSEMLAVGRSIQEEKTTPQYDKERAKAAPLERLTSTQDTVLKATDAAATGISSTSHDLAGLGVTTADAAMNLSRIPTALILLNALKNELTAKSKILEEKEKKLSDPSLNKEDKKSLENEVKALKNQVAQLNKKLFEQTFALANSVANSAHAVPTALVELVTAEGRTVASMLEASQTMGVAGASLVGAISNFISFVGDVMECREISQQLEIAQNALKNETNPDAIYRLQNEIAALISKRDQSINNIVQHSTKSAGGLVQAGGQVLQSIVRAAPHLGATAARGMTLAATIAGPAASAGGVILSAKLVLDNVNKHTNIDVSIKTMKEHETNLVALLAMPGANHQQLQILLNLVQVKIKNLEFQKQDNIVDTIKNSVSFASSIAGTTAGALAVVGATTGAVAIVGSTAGIGAIALAAGAVVIGGGYYVYKNRHQIAARADQAINLAKEKRHQLEIALADREKGSVTETTKSQLRAETQEVNEKIEALRAGIEADTARLEAQIKMKEAKLPTIKSEHERAKITTEIRNLKADIQEINSTFRQVVLQKKAEAQARDIQAIMKQMDEVDAKISGLYALKKATVAESVRISEFIENLKISDVMKDCSAEEIETLRKGIDEALKDPITRSEIENFLLASGMDVKGRAATTKDVMSFLTSSL